MKLSDQDRSFIHLILRSKDDGDDWRVVSDKVWPLAEMFYSRHTELLEVEVYTMSPRPPLMYGRIRLTEKGKIVAEYLT